MHANLLESDEIDYNLYPALLQVFAIILIGYLAGNFDLLSKEQVLGLNRFVSTFALPSLLFKSIAVLDLNSVNWTFLSSIFLSKSIVFILAILITLLTLRPTNIGLAAVFAIFVSQSNDFALGYPIVDAVYSKTHPDYLHYIYLIAPISLCILNPIAFLMLEANEIINQKRISIRQNNCLNESTEDEDEEEEENEVFEESINNDENLIKRSTRMINIDSSHSSQNDFRNLLNKFKITESKSNKVKKELNTLDLIKTTLWSTISNPIVFMTLIGIIANFILKQKIPNLIDPILTTLSNSFSALALFYLGFSMVGKIKNLSFSSIIIILILVLSKGLIYPLINRELILHLNQDYNNQTNTTVDVESLSTFGFLYGTFPTAPSLFFYITRYKSIGDDLISAAVVFGTMASVPLMMISGKMISLKYNSSTVSNFEDIACKTAYGFSFLTWFCCLWVLYIFLASGRAWKKPFRFTLFLIISQLFNSLIHIIWSSLTTNLENLNPVFGLIHVSFALFSAFLTRCWPLTIMLSLISLSGISRFNQYKMLMFLVKLADSTLLSYFIGFGLPLLTTILCLIVGGIPEKQSMIITVGKPQIIIANVLLFLIITSVFYCMIIFARTKNEQNSFLSLISNPNPKRKRYYSLVGSSITDNNNNQRLLSENDPEIVVDDSNIPVSQRTLGISEYGKNDFQLLNDQYQIMQHLSLIIILSFNSLMCLFFQMWVLFDEKKSGIFYELQLIDTTLLYGQGFFTFLAFGFDNEFIFAPVAFKIKELLRIIEPFKLPPIEQVSQDTINICKKFEEKYKHRCSNDIVKNQRFHYKYYTNVFKGSDLVEWLMKRKLVETRIQGEELGRKLIYGRIVSHVSQKRNFYDGFHLYKFNVL